MWTPRRIFLGLVGLLAVAATYFGYARALGRFDGLPPLPEEYRQPDPDHVPPANPLPPGTSMERKFELAFGPYCPELRWAVKTEMHAKGILLAAMHFEIIKEGERAGWGKLYPLSVASLGKKLGADGTPEISTLFADVAYIRFDKDVKSVTDLSGRRIVAAELHADPDAPLADARRGRIRIQNNRRTLHPDDDIEMVTPGPVYYEDEPEKGKPHIYTHAKTAIQVTDHLNTGLAVPDRTIPREPTVSGEGMRVYLTREAKEEKQPPKKGEPRLGLPRKDPKPGMSGVDRVELDHAVEMNLWTEANASFVAPGGDSAKKDPKAARPAPDPKGPKKGLLAADKRLLQIRTRGPFFYDLTRELAHFEKPADAKPGLSEHVQVTRAGRVSGQDMLDCEVLDVQLQRKKPPEAPKDAPPRRKQEGPPGAGDGDLEIKSIRATGEMVVVTSDSDNLNATGVELVHEAEARMTVLKGNARQPMQAVKDGNLIRGSELHLFGDGKEISQAHVLGAGSVGLGELDPDTGEYFKEATWTDRLVFTRLAEKDQPPVDVLTFLGKDGGKAVFKDTSSGDLQRIEAHQLKVWLEPKDQPKDGKKPPAKTVSPKDESKADVTRSARPRRLEATGGVKSTSPEVVIRQTDYLNVQFKDVPKLIKPPADPKAKEPGKAVAAKGPAGPKAAPPAAKGAPAGEPAKEVPKKKEPPLLVTARKIETWVNRDPKGRNEIDRVVATGDVEAHQDPATKDEEGTDIAGDKVTMQAYPEGNHLLVEGDQFDRKNLKWGVVKFDKLTIFGFHITIDQRDNTSFVKGEGSMEIISASDLEGKKLEKPTTMTIYWNHKMDFHGSEKLILYHGNVLANQEASKLTCQWMQVVLDRPVFLNRDARPKPVAQKVVPGEKKPDDSPKIDTVMCFHAPKDDDVPRPRSVQPVTVVEEIMEGDRMVRFQSIQAPDVVAVNTPVEGGKARHDLTATSSDTMPGTVRIWQAGPKDGALGDKPAAKGPPPKKAGPPRKKGDLAPDQEMKLTIVQFGGKMIANDLRKRAKFFTNVRAVHVAADDPKAPVDLRGGDIPKGAVYLEARDTLEVFATTQMERDPQTGELVEKSYQEMIAIGNVRVRKQGEFFGDADRVTYSELKGTLTFHGSDKNPAVVNQQRGQGIPDKVHAGRTIIYNTRTKTFETIGATRITN